MTISFHEGELGVQERAGVRAMAERVGQSVHGSVSPAARHFMATQRFAVVGGSDDGGRVWASPLTGRRGFVSAPGESLVRVEVMPSAGDPLRAALRAGAPVGLIIIDLARRARMRVNGVVLRETSSLFEVEAREVYTNCPKYIQARASEAVGGSAAPEQAAERSPSLGAEQREFIARADTFFIATAHPERGADASHRGGLPGFVRVEGDRRLVWPDYSGNAMFNTLGNLTVDPRAGLLFIDFENGDTLTGQRPGRNHLGRRPGGRVRRCRARCGVRRRGGGGDPRGAPATLALGRVFALQPRPPLSCRRRMNAEHFTTLQPANW